MSTQSILKKPWQPLPQAEFCRRIEVFDRTEKESCPKCQHFCPKHPTCPVYWMSLWWSLGYVSIVSDVDIETLVNPKCCFRRLLRKRRSLQPFWGCAAALNENRNNDAAEWGA